MKLDAEGRVIVNAPIDGTPTDPPAADEAVADTVPPAPAAPSTEEDVLPGEEGESPDLTIGTPYIVRGAILLPIGQRTLALTIGEAEQLAADLIDVIAQL